MNRGYIKLWRKITEWEWYDDVNTCRVFIHLLIGVNHKDAKWRGKQLYSGETIKSLETLAMEANLSVQSVRTSINKLKSTGELTERKHGKFRILKLENHRMYHDSNGAINSESTVNQQGINRESTADKNVKNVKNDKNEKKIVSVREETETLFDSIDDLCSRHGIENRVNKKALDVLVERYVGKIRMKVEAQHCISWLLDKNMKTISTPRLGNWMKKALEFQKREQNRLLEPKEKIGRNQLREFFVDTKPKENLQYIKHG